MDSVEEELLTVEQVQELLKVGRTFAYSLVKSGELPSYRVGRLHLQRQSYSRDPANYRRARREA